MSSFLNSLNNLNDKIITFFNVPIVKYGFLILVVINILVMEYITTSYLEIYNLTGVKVLYAFLIAYCACFDPVYSIALTTLIIISLQELYGRHANKKNNNLQKKINNIKELFSPTEVQVMSMNPQIVKYENNLMPSSEYLASEENIFTDVNKNTLQKNPVDKDKKLIAEYDYYEDPAFKTITANLKDREIIGKNNFYITDNDLVSAQNNNVNNNKYNAIQMFEGSINNIQGLPNGYDEKK